MTFEAALGLEYQRVETTEVVANLTVREHLLGQDGRLHGGVFACAAEAMASVGTGVAVVEEGMVAYGMNLSSRVLGDSGTGERLTFTAKRLDASVDTWTWIVEAANAEGALRATATVAVAVRLAAP